MRGGRQAGRQAGRHRQGFSATVRLVRKLAGVGFKFLILSILQGRKAGREIGGGGGRGIESWGRGERWRKGGRPRGGREREGAREREKEREIA